MFDWIYKKCFCDDFEIWVGKGWLSFESVVVILEEQECDNGCLCLLMVLVGIGMVCVVLVLFVFIVVNWGFFLKMVKLIGIVVLVIGVNGFVVYVVYKECKGIFDFVIGFVILVFVGGMVLVGQMFYLLLDWVGGFFLVCFGGLVVVWFIGLCILLVVVVVVVIIW